MKGLEQGRKGCEWGIQNDVGYGKGRPVALGGKACSQRNTSQERHRKVSWREEPDRENKKRIGSTRN